MISQAERKLTYPIALILSTARRKTFESLGATVEISGDKVAILVNSHAASTEELIKLAQKIFKRKKIYLIIDDTIIDKIYSKAIEGACDNYSSADRKSYRSLCSVVAMLTDGVIAIPITQALWLSSEFSKVNHKTKWQLAQGLIFQLKGLVNLYMVLADGLYAVENFMHWLIEQGIRFEMRFHANRVVEIDDEQAQIRKSSKFKLSGKTSKRTRRGKWKNMDLFFTGFRRITKVGTIIITYQVSNYKASAREHTQNYGYRWNIEKFFRTAKQKLGLNDCQSRKRETQEKHIMTVFLTYALVQLERQKNRLKNAEAAIKQLKSRNFSQLLTHFSRSAEIFAHA